MTVLEAREVSKRFAGEHAVRDLSLRVEPGEIFGLLGPNGAGKTTLLRMAMDIFKPDGGEIRVLGERDLGRVRERVGYLPEERGLYDGDEVRSLLRYLGRLKGLSKGEAAEAADRELRRVSMQEHAGDQVKELSKGMAQKIQIAAVLLHDPELVILDEPFSGLDPVNTRLVRDLVLDLRSEGRTVLLSTHLMDHVESLCDRVLMLSGGDAVLRGPVDEVKREFGGRRVRVAPASCAAHLDRDAETRGAHAEVLIRDESPTTLLRTLVERGAEPERFEILEPSLDDVFVDVAEGER